MKRQKLEAGEGRLIPLKQGYMFKRSGSSGLYRRKYVILCSNSVLTYYPSFQSYMENMDGKEIQLGHVTVKIPGRKPAGIQSAAEARPGVEKEDLTEELCGEASGECGRQTSRRKRLSVSEQTAAHELVLVSLCGGQWYFQLCSQAEVDSWERSIQAEILHSLSEQEAVSLERVRGLPGNQTCADCGAVAPDWASINLGILVCIECSGIHRNLGSHVSKVRSLSLDAWTAGNIKTLENVGNSKANEYWEGNLKTDLKIKSESSRNQKEWFIQSKYVTKTFAKVQAEEKVENLI